MAEPSAKLPIEDDDAPEALYALRPGVVKAISEALADGRDMRVRRLVLPLHYTDFADLLERLTTDERRQVVELVRARFDPEVLPELDEAVRAEVIEILGPEETAQAVTELDSDDAVELIDELEDEVQQQVLDAIPEADRAIIEESLAYEEDSAGRLMQRELVAVPTLWTVGETIDHLREDRDLPDDFYDIFVVDPAHRPVGAVKLNRLLRTRRPVRVSDIMDEELKTIPVDLDQEEVAQIFRQHDLTSAPVIDEVGRLMGSITIDDVVDVIDEEFEEDLMRLGGVKEDDLYRAALTTTRARFTWLLVNLATAICASLVIAAFEGTIEQIVALAVLMPIVASMGGNAGTQTLTVAVRAIATKELTTTNAMRIVWKEVMVGGFNGVMFAALTGAVAGIWFSSVQLGLVIGAAMIINMLVAGLSGILIPIVLDRSGIDPAVASSVILTTVTDVVGFFAFLGLAAVFLL